MHAAQVLPTSPQPAFEGQSQDEDHDYTRDRPSTTSSNEHQDYLYRTRSRSTAHTQSPKRLSAFSGRSRSNTTASTASSRRSPASSMTSVEASSLPSFQDGRPSSAAPTRSERQESMTRSLLSRGSRILRRQGSKFNISATLDEEDEADRAHRSKVEISDFLARTTKLRRSNEHLKRLISDPFDFHHLTHTSPAQFRSLDKTREVDLVTEFSAIRASQKPEAGLKGIRAEDIHFRDFSSSEDLTNYEPVTTQERPSSVESVSPTSHASRARSESRVFENFSRPMPRYPRADSTTPPSATSSKLASSPDMSEPAPRAIDEILGLHSPQTYPEHVYSTAEEAEKISASMAQITLEGIFQLNGGVHARAGSSANTLTSDLEDVPEEEEEVNCWRDSPELSPRLPACRSSSSLNQLSARALSSIPNPKSRFPACIADELSTKFSNALGSPTLPQYRLFQEGTLEDQTEEAAKESPIAKTVVYEDISESWDDDIDFCYEHAAESNCNFDWFSTNEPVKQLTSETLYGQNLAADNESKGHFPLGTHAVIRPADLPVSPQSNLSQLSRYNSEESLILSRAASIVRKHRSSVSTNSVPELVHSSTSSREGTVAESSAHETSVSPRSPSIPVPVRPGSSSRHHRQTKSLAPEIERHARSMAPRTHDRARSASEGATQIRSRAIKTDGSQLPTVKQSSASKGAGRKKGRVSYSLFPSPEGVAV